MTPQISVPYKVKVSPANMNNLAHSSKNTQRVMTFDNKVNEMDDSEK
jgi:hypothetical protein